MNQPLKARLSAPAPEQVNVGPFRSSRPMDPREAAEYLHLDKKTVTEWARKGYIPAHPLGEGTRKIWRFLEHELVDWLNSKTNYVGQK
jgi:excisionase family DNA binding protein